MPANLTVEYYKAESEFRNAKTRERKIKALFSINNLHF